MSEEKCMKVCKHGNYCINDKNHEGNCNWHNSAMGLRFKYCDCE